MVNNSDIFFDSAVTFPRLFRYTNLGTEFDFDPRF